MLAPPVPQSEPQRILALRATDMLFTPAEERFDRITRLASRLLGTPTPLVEMRSVRLDGSVILVEAVSEWIVFDRQPAILTVIRDVSERKRMEATQARLAAIVQSSNDAIISRTLDGTILTWNPGAEKMLGFTAEEIIGRSVALTLPPDHVSNRNKNNEVLGNGDILIKESTGHCESAQAACRPPASPHRFRYRAGHGQDDSGTHF